MLDRDGGGGEQRRGLMFSASVLGTVAIGLVLGGMAIYYFRAPPALPPVVIHTAPETRYVEKESPPPLPAPRAPRRPAARMEARSTWDGVWRRERYPLPMFELKQAGNEIMGNLAPDWSGVYPFRGGRIVGNAVEFVVTDLIFRAHFRLTMLGPDRAKVEAWVTDEDWLFGFANAQNAVTTPQQAVAARMILEYQARLRGKPKPLGTFSRSSSEFVSSWKQPGSYGKGR